jgi:hypothetical protein
MTCEGGSSDLALSVFWGAAGLAILLTLYVMQKTERDQINKFDPSWIRWWRRFGFWAMALLLVNSMLDYASQLSLMLVFGSGVHSLAVNAVALTLRAPPPSDHRSVHSPYLGYITAREFDTLSRELAGLDRGQSYTHKLVEAILLHMELTPDPAGTVVVYPTYYHQPQSS